MNFMKNFFYVTIFLHSFGVTASWLSNDRESKKFDLSSAKFGFENGKFFASVKEEPSALRKIFGMKGVEHKVETARLLPKEQDYKVKVSPMQMDRSLQVTVSKKDLKEVDDLLSCCCAIIEDCCGKTTKKD